MKVLAVIPARAGSKRITNKNRQEVGGIELWEHALRFALNEQLIDYVCVSSDDEEILKRSESHALVRWFELAADTTPMAEVLRQTVSTFELMWNDVVVCLQPTNPFRTHEDLMQCYQARGPANSAATCDQDGRRDGNVYITRVGMLHQGRVFDRWTILVRSHTSLDINTPEDLERARRLWDERRLRNPQ